jgi:ubiquinone/menaquinone biosynthesis C-methylase UbiE
VHLSPYDRIARFYDLFAGSSERPLREAGLRLLVPAPGERVLEIGCGTGDTLVHLGRALAPGGLAVGLDLSTGMLRVAARRLARPRVAAEDRAGLGPCAALVHADALRLPFEESSFDALFMSFSLELFADEAIDGLLGGCRRVLRPSGRLVAVCMAARDPEGFASRIYRWSHEHFPTLVDCRPVDARALLEKAGFTVVVREEMAVAGLPVHALLARRD